jgi:hypothetical protein
MYAPAHAINHRSGCVGVVTGCGFVAEAGSEQRTRKFKKGSSPTFSIRTRRPSLPIISSLKALLARRLFHPRTPIRFVRQSSWCLPSEIRYNRPPLCQVDMSPRRLAGSIILYFPKMSLRLFCGVVNPKRAENGAAKPSQQALCNHLRLFAPRIRSSNQTR